MTFGVLNYDYLRRGGTVKKSTISFAGDRITGLVCPFPPEEGCYCIATSHVLDMHDDESKYPVPYRICRSPYFPVLLLSRS